MSCSAGASVAPPTFRVKVSPRPLPVPGSSKDQRSRQNKKWRVVLSDNVVIKHEHRGTLSDIDITTGGLVLGDA